MEALRRPALLLEMPVGMGRHRPASSKPPAQDRGHSGSLTKGIFSHCHVRRCKWPKVHGHHHPSSGHPRSRA